MKIECNSPGGGICTKPSVAGVQYAKAMMAMQKLAGQVLALGAAGVVEAQTNGIGPGTLGAMIADDMVETSGRLVTAAMAAVAAVVA